MRRSWLALGSALALLGCSPEPQRPNVLWVVWDTTRADHLSLYGYERKTTPYLEEFAKQARVFEDCQSSSCWTVPSHASMFTGLLPAATTRVVERYDGAARQVRGRFRPFEASALVEIAFTTGKDKLGIYGDVVADLAADQFAWIRDPAHRRRLTEAEGVASVALACAADRLALAGR